LSKKNIRIGFIGAGSIGSLFGGYLAELRSDIYSSEVIFFGKKAHADEVNKNGLKLDRNQQIRVIRSIRAYGNEKSFDALIKQDPSFRFDYIFLTTKAYDSKSAIIQYKKVIDRSEWLVILQNGIGNEEIVIPYCKASKIIRVVTTLGALLVKPGHVIHTGEGFTKLGFPFVNDLTLENQEIEEAKLELTLLKDILNLAGLDTVIAEDIIQESWEKVLVNIGINALGALTRLPNGKLLEIKDLKHIMGEAIKEAIEVAEMKKVKLTKKNYIEMAFEVAKKTAENKNSMLQDILNGQSTEIEYMNGRILKYAKDLGINVPYNEALTYLIRGLEHSVI